jgi:hypothetical protein
MSHVYEKAAIHILDWFHHAERDLIGKHITRFDGKSGTVQDVKLDDHHSLMFTLDDTEKSHHRARWFPVSTIKEKSR